MQTKTKRRGSQNPSVEADEPSSGLLSLSAELLEMTTQLLSFVDVCRLGACHSQLRSVALSDSVWRGLYKRDFPCGRQSAGTIGWRLCYKRAVLALPCWENLRQVDLIREYLVDQAVIEGFCVDLKRQHVIVLISVPGLEPKPTTLSAGESDNVRRHGMLACQLSDRQLVATSTPYLDGRVCTVLLDKSADECVIVEQLDDDFELVISHPAELQEHRRVLAHNWTPDHGECVVSGWRFYSLSAGNAAEVGVFCTKTGDKLCSLPTGFEPVNDVGYLAMDALGRLVVGVDLAWDPLAEPVVFRLEENDGIGGATAEFVDGAYAGVLASVSGLAFSPDGWAAALNVFNEDERLPHGVNVMNSRGYLMASWEPGLGKERFIQWSDDGIVVATLHQIIVLQPKGSDSDGEDAAAESGKSKKQTKKSKKASKKVAKRR
eukprot:TRINITY_DN4921_c0_g1_i2.p1 TRINITY_DN4921_c0_g1~~TRINITY_DN4921_c0_g1_i2.p1  ORF type:complete len:433 (-),score=91.08 TRINITY_DN4921_c0_g1_i2:181-1479(-)